MYSHFQYEHVIIKVLERGKNKYLHHFFQQEKIFKSNTKQRCDTNL